MGRSFTGRTFRESQRALGRRPKATTSRHSTRAPQDWVLQLQRTAGNQAVARLLGGRSQPLDPETRTDMEAQLGGDFSSVRVHTDESAAAMTHANDARALTTGSDVYFEPGAYAPRTKSGRALLAHELAHVVQQSRPARTAGAVTSDTLEAEAQQAAATPAQASLTPGAAPAGSVQLAKKKGSPPTTTTSIAPKAPEMNPPPALEEGRIKRAEELPTLTGRQLKQWERIKQKLNASNLTLNKLGFEEEQVIPLLRGGRVNEFLGEIEKRADVAAETKGAIAGEFAQRQRLEDPFSYLYEMGGEAAGGSTVESRTWPGNRGQSRSSTAGVFMHSWAEDVIVGRLARAGPGSAEAAELRAQLRLTWPAGVMPNEGPNRLVIRLQGGKTYIPDGIDWATGTIYELKPEGREREGLEQGYIYAAWMDIEYRRGAGFKWAFEVATYSMSGAQEYLTGIGYLAPRPAGRGGGGSGTQGPVRPAVAADAPAHGRPAAAETAEEIFAAELQAAGRTGRLSERGIEALWELEPRVAEYLLGSSRLPKAEQRRVLGQLPGRPLPLRGRVGAAGMLALQLAMDVGPAVQAELERERSQNVGAAMADVLWWLDKGVAPHVVGVNDRLYPRENEPTTDLAKVLELHRAGDLDYLAITSIDEEEIETGFVIWASSHLVSYRDWFEFIESSKAIRGTGDDLTTRQWSFRAGDVKDVWYGFDVTEVWLPSPALTRVLNTAATTMLKGRPEEAGRARQVGTEEAIASLASGPGPQQGPQLVSERYKPFDVFGGLPQATGKKRFRDPRRILHRIGTIAWIEGFSADSVLYTFPASVVDAEVPDGYVVVGGADFATYAQIYLNNSLSPVGRRELMLAREDHLEDVR
jgi:hypothetical protein